MRKFLPLSSPPREQRCHLPRDFWYPLSRLTWTTRVFPRLKLGHRVCLCIPPERSPVKATLDGFISPIKMAATLIKDVPLGNVWVGGRPERSVDGGGGRRGGRRDGVRLTVPLFTSRRQPWSRHRVAMKEELWVRRLTLD